MAYRLSMDDRPGDSLRACAIEQIEQAAEHLGEARRQQDPVEAIHGARKALKRTRSVLRLVESGPGRSVARREDRRLRDRGRALSGTRDADVMAATVEALTERYTGQMPASTFASVREQLAVRGDGVRAGLEPLVLGETEALRSVAERLAQWPVEDVTWRHVLAGVERTYRRGRKAFARVRRAPAVDNLHEWRKRVKDLDFQQRLLHDAWPQVLSAHAREAHRLSELLGEDHDLAILAALLEVEHGPAQQVAADTDPLLEVIARRRADLQGRAQVLGRRVYADPPSDFARRLRRLVKAARLKAGEERGAAGGVPA